MNKQEKLAWAQVLAALFTLVYLVWRLFFSDLQHIGAPEAWDDVHNVNSMVFYLLLLCLLWVWYRGKDAFEDERDKAISAASTQAGGLVLVILLLISTNAMGWGFAELYIGFLRAQSMEWYEVYLIACMACAWLTTASVSVFHYWRDRR